MFTVWFHVIKRRKATKKQLQFHFTILRKNGRLLFFLLYSILSLLSLLALSLSKTKQHWLIIIYNNKHVISFFPVKNPHWSKGGSVWRQRKLRTIIVNILDSKLNKRKYNLKGNRSQGFSLLMWPGDFAKLFHPSFSVMCSRDSFARNGFPLMSRQSLSCQDQFGFHCVVAAVTACFKVTLCAHSFLLWVFYDI